MAQPNTRCDKCGEGDMVVKSGRYGNFTACSNFPDCKNILKENKQAGPPPERTGEQCDKCNVGEMVIRSGQYGKFKACSTFPKCRNTKKVEAAA